MSDTLGTLDETVELTAYSDDWASDAAIEGARVLSALDGIEVEIQHIGSTAVPGLEAKPVIDLQAGLGDLRFEEAAVERLVPLGYEDMGEAGVQGRRYLRLRGPLNCNVHLMQLRGLIWDNNLVFRDYLRTHPKDAKEYAAAKRRALGTAGNRLLAYSAAKEDAVRRVSVLATAWARARNS